MSEFSENKIMSSLKIILDGKEIFNGFTLKNEKEITSEVTTIGNEFSCNLLASLIFHEYKFEYYTDDDDYRRDGDGKTIYEQRDSVWYKINTMTTTFSLRLNNIFDKYFRNSPKYQKFKNDIVKYKYQNEIYHVFVNILRKDGYRSTFDASTEKLLFENGVVDMGMALDVNVSVRPPNFYDHITKTIPYTFPEDSSFQEEQWNTDTLPFLKKTYFNENQLNRFLDIVRKCAFKRIHVEQPTVVWIQGGPRSGKTVIAKILQTMFGNELCIWKNESELSHTHMYHRQKPRVVLCNVSNLEPVDWDKINTIINGFCGVKSICAFVFFSEIDHPGYDDNTPENFACVYNDATFYRFAPPERGVSFKEESPIYQIDIIARNLLWYALTHK